VIIPTPPQLDDTYSGMSTVTSLQGILAECGTLAELTCNEN
jgi:hypothetical protein